VVGAGTGELEYALVPADDAALGNPGLRFERLRHRTCTGEVGEDPADIRGWTWPSRS
jgi:hypothetical protein